MQVWKQKQYGIAVRCGCRNNENGGVGVGAEVVDIKLEVWEQK